MWIIDNFLPPSLHEDLHGLLLGREIDWKYVQGASGPNADEFYFIHPVIGFNHTSPLFNDIKPILYFMDDKMGFVIDKLLRINCTLHTNIGTRVRTMMHVDMPKIQNYTGIYYVNTCNGPTVIEDTEVDSVANRFVLFDGSKMHCGTIQDDTYVRANIVFNMQGHFRENNS